MVGLLQVKDADGMLTKCLPLEFLGLAQTGHCWALEEPLSFLHFIISRGRKK